VPGRPLRQGRAARQPRPAAIPAGPDLTRRAERSVRRRGPTDGPTPGTPTAPGLLVTHDVDEAVLLADRVVVLQDGRVGLDLTVDLPQPRSPRDAGFQDYRERLLGAWRHRAGLGEALS
jgi:hypothetical protein